MRALSIGRVAGVASIAGLLSSAGLAVAASPPPLAPSGLSVTPASGGRVVLSWSDNSESEIGFRIEREPGGKDWPREVLANETMFTDQPGLGRFVYRVVALGDGVESASSDAVTISVRTRAREARAGAVETVARRAPGPALTTISPRADGSESGTTSPSGEPSAGGTGSMLQLVAPGGVRADVGAGWVRVSWRDRSTGETGHLVERERYEGTSWVDSTVIPVPVGLTQFEEVLSPGVYRYRIRAMAVGAESASSPWVVASLGGGTPESSGSPVPSMPGGLGAMDIGNGRVMLSWDDRSAAEQGFQIERDPSWVSGVMTVGANVTAFVDAAGVGTFKYRVRAIGTGSPSAFTPWTTVSVAGGTTGEIGMTPPSSGGGSSSPTGLSGGGSSSGGSGGGSTGGGGSGGSGGGGGGGGGGGSGGGGGGGTGGGSGGASGSGSAAEPPAAGSGPSPTGGPEVIYGSDLTPGLPIGSDGWTIIPPLPAGARAIHVSSSTGDDRNIGSADSPKRTLAAGHAALRSGSGDRLLLRSGDVFAGTLIWNRSGRSLAEPMIVTSYGDGPRPQIQSRDGIGIQVDPGPGLRHVAFIGLHFVDVEFADLDPSRPVSGIYWVSGVEDLLIEDCKFERYATGLALQGFQGTLSNVKLRRNVLVDSFRRNANGGGVNLYMSRYDGVLLEENVLDIATEVLASGRYLSQNMYLAADGTDRTVVRRNVARNAGRANFAVRSGGLVEDNLSIRGAMGFEVGTFDSPQFPTIEFRNNVVIESRDNSNGQPLGIGFHLAKAESVMARGNLIINGTDGTDHRAFHVASSRVRGFVAENNIIWNWVNADPGTQGNVVFALLPDPAGRVVLRNNQVQQPRNSSMVMADGPNWPVGTMLEMGGNLYSSPLAPGRWFSRGTQSYSLPQWAGLVNDTTSRAEQMTYPDPGRTIAGYMTWVSTSGGTSGGSGSGASGAGMDSGPSLVEALRAASRQNWRPELSAARVNAYLRAGFGR